MEPTTMISIAQSLRGNDQANCHDELDISPISGRMRRMTMQDHRIVPHCTGITYPKTPHLR